MIATGYLYCLGRRAKKQTGTFGFRLVRVLAIGSVTGIVAAPLLLYFFRRQPADMGKRMPKRINEDNFTTEQLRHGEER